MAAEAGFQPSVLVLLPQYQLILIVLRSAIGQAEEGETVRLSDDLRPCLGHKRLHRRTTRRTGDKIGRVIKKIDGERAFTNKLALIRRTPVTANKDKIGIRLANPNVDRRLYTSGNHEARRQGAYGCERTCVPPSHEPFSYRQGGEHAH